uniref:Tetratricopeptide repeat protein n=1 Tax=Schlesneria paludicola TaxID=360056 RepID=A0A7C4QS31_9PLAN
MAIEEGRDDNPAAVPCLQGERVAFTGTLASMTHRRAAELVEERGGQAVAHVSQNTTLLVVGEEGWPLEPDGRPSLKLQQAQHLQQRGHPIRILSESEWLAVLRLEPAPAARQLYTPAMLSQILNVSAHAIRRWERMGLIHAVKRVLRLPYFDYAEVTAARRLVDLLAAGADIRQLAASLRRLQTVLPNVARPLAQLELLAQGRRTLYRDAAGWIEPATGQRVFVFDEPPESDNDEPITISLPFASRQDRSVWTADDWFRQGCALAEDGALTAAVEAFRLALLERPLEPDFHFHLADTLYRLGNRTGAIERYYTAVELDHDFIEAWTQLGCVLAELDDDEGAQQAFQAALDRHPDYPDAHFHLAQLLDRRGETEAALRHWQTYLRFDVRGPWAEIARQRLASTFGSSTPAEPLSTTAGGQQTSP